MQGAEKGTDKAVAMLATRQPFIIREIEFQRSITQDFTRQDTIVNRVRLYLSANRKRQDRSLAPLELCVPEINVLLVHPVRDHLGVVRLRASDRVRRSAS